jgi:hypothetical protein
MNNTTIGKIYKTAHIRVNNNKVITVASGYKLKTIKTTPNMKDIHYFNFPPRYIPNDEVVEVVGYWFNYYGRYIRCKYNNDIFDVNPSDLDIT